LDKFDWRRTVKEEMRIIEKIAGNS